MLEVLVLPHSVWVWVTVVPPFWPWLKRIGDQKHPDQLSGGCQIFERGRGSNLGLYICRKEGPGSEGSGFGPNVKRILHRRKETEARSLDPPCPPLMLKHLKHTGSVAERSKALVLGTSLLGGVGSNPTAANSFPPFLFPLWSYTHRLLDKYMYILAANKNKYTLAK